MRRATIVGHVLDVWGARWDVREWRQTRHGFALAFGWPAAEVRGQGGAGGPRVIMTKPLRVHLEAHRDNPRALALPIGATAIKRLRRLLGHHRHIDRAQWWERRIADLSDLTVQQFSERHHVAIGAVVNARHALLGPTLRPAGWWRVPDVAGLILAKMSSAEIADALGLSASAVRRLRAVLRQQISAATTTLAADRRT